MSAPKCIEPTIGERVTEEAKGGRPVVARELRDHLYACADCRALVERTRRMTLVWRQLEPRRGEVEAARMAFFARRAVPARPRIAPPVLAVAILLAAAAAFGSARLASRLREPPAPPRRELVAPATRSELRPPAEPVTGARPPPPATLPPPTPTSSAPLLGAPSLSASAASLRPWASAASAKSVRPSAPARDVRQDAAGHATSPAQALEEGEPPRRGDLARASDPKVRDEARLALAQLRLAQGRSADARPDLVELASGGATAFVKKRAAEALRALDDSSRSQRAGTNSP
jgi:hypothetical protein